VDERSIAPLVHLATPAGLLLGGFPVLVEPFVALGVAAARDGREAVNAARAALAHLARSFALLVAAGTTAYLVGESLPPVLAATLLVATASAAIYLQIAVPIVASICSARHGAWRYPMARQPA